MANATFCYLASIKAIVKVVIEHDVHNNVIMTVREMC